MRLCELCDMMWTQSQGSANPTRCGHRAGAQRTQHDVDTEPVLSEPSPCGYGGPGSRG